MQNNSKPPNKGMYCFLGSILDNNSGPVQDKKYQSIICLSIHLSIFFYISTYISVSISNQNAINKNVFC